MSSTEPSQLCVLICFIALALSIAGCGPQEPAKIPTVEIYTGTTALEAEFVSGSPPQSVFQSERFPVGISLKNTGAHDIVDGVLSLSIDQSYLRLVNWESDRIVKAKPSWQQIVFDLEGKKDTLPRGGNEIVTAIMEAQKLAPMEETHSVDFLATVCYKYQTIFSDTVCIDTDVYSPVEQEKVCAVAASSYSSQGGPVAVVLVEPKMLYISEKKIGPEFMVHIDQVGDGLIVEQDNVTEFCSSGGVTQGSVNKVHISAELVGLPLECKPNPILIGETSRMKYSRCTLKSGLDSTLGNYQTVLRVVLDYGVTDTISTQVQIQK